MRQERLELYKFFFGVECNDDSELADEERLDMLAAQIVAYIILRNERIIKRINERASK